MPEYPKGDELDSLIETAVDFVEPAPGKEGKCRAKIRRTIEALRGAYEASQGADTRTDYRERLERIAVRFAGARAGLQERDIQILILRHHGVHGLPVDFEKAIELLKLAETAVDAASKDESLKGRGRGNTYAKTFGSPQVQLAEAGIEIFQRFSSRPTSAKDNERLNGFLSRVWEAATGDMSRTNWRREISNAGKPREGLRAAVISRALSKARPTRT